MSEREAQICTIIDRIINGDMTVEEFVKEPLTDKERAEIMEAVFYGIQEGDYQ